VAYGIVILHCNLESVTLKVFWKINSKKCVRELKAKKIGKNHLNYKGKLNNAK